MSADCDRCAESYGDARPTSGVFSAVKLVSEWPLDETILKARIGLNLAYNRGDISHEVYGPLDGCIAFLERSTKSRP